jgi:hypothetical protein
MKSSIALRLGSHFVLRCLQSVHKQPLMAVSCQSTTLVCTHWVVGILTKGFLAWLGPPMFCFKIFVKNAQNELVMRGLLVIYTCSMARKSSMFQGGSICGGKWASLCRTWQRTQKTVFGHCLLSALCSMGGGSQMVWMHSKDSQGAFLWKHEKWTCPSLVILDTLEHGSLMVWMHP